tara:strand:- start:1717 stop:3990 length:2274 start_codon:yes stop_codon:yes gene_type:complete
MILFSTILISLAILAVVGYAPVLASAPPTPDQEAAAQRQRDLLRETAEEAQKHAEATSAAADSHERMVESLEAVSQATADTQRVFREFAKDYDGYRQKLLEEKDDLEKKAASTQVLSTIERQRLETIEEQLKLTKDVVEELDEQLSRHKKIENAQKKALNLQREGEQVMGSIAGLLGIANTRTGGLAMRMYSFSKRIAEAKKEGASLNEVWKGMAKTAAVMFNPLTVGFSLFEKGIQMLIYMVGSLDIAQSSFNRATGAAGAYNSTIAAIHQNNLLFGVSAQDSSESVQALYEGFSKFSTLAGNAKTKIGELGAKMAKVGVSNEAFAKSTEEMTRSLGLTTEEVDGFTMRTIKMAKEIGISNRQAIDNFIQLSPRLAAYGRDGEKVFKGLTAASKATGLSVASLTNVVGEQLDTFEGSAKAAGSLNALLGGPYLNSIELLNATEEERIALLKGAVDASGKQWASMDRFERKALASAAGINDLSEASKFFGTSADDIEKVEEKMSGQEMSTRELNKSLRETISIMEELKNIVQAGIIEAFNKSGVTMNGIIKKTRILTGYLIDLVTWFKETDITAGQLALGGVGFAFLPSIISGLSIALITKLVPAFGAAGAAAEGAAVKGVSSFSKMGAMLGKMGLWAGGAAVAAYGGLALGDALFNQDSPEEFRLSNAFGLFGPPDKQTTEPTNQRTPTSRPTTATSTSVTAARQNAFANAGSAAATASTAAGSGDIILELDSQTFARAVGQAAKIARNKTMSIVG